MKSFDTFLKNKISENGINEAAQLMADMEIEPAQWILEWSKKFPALELMLLEDVNQLEELLVENPAFATSPTFGNTMKQVGQSIGNYFAGPQRRFNAAISALNWLKSKIDTIPGKDGLKTSTGATISDWLGTVMKELGAQAGQIPALMQRYEQQAAAQQQAAAPSPQNQAQPNPTPGAPPAAPAQQQAAGTTP